MAKYEIMAVLSGKLDETAAKKAIGELADTLKGVTDFKLVDHGIKQLAYVVNGEDRGYYVQFNFEGTGPQVAEFRRLAIINPLVLRQLVINLEKDYGYRQSINPDKVKRLEKKRVLKADYDKRREEEIKNNPELANRYRDRRGGGGGYYRRDRGGYGSSGGQGRSSYSDANPNRRQGNNE